MLRNKLPNLRILNKSQKVKLLALVVILIALPVFVLLVQGVVRYLSRAQAILPTFYFTPSPTSLNNGQETTLTLRLDPKGNKISGVTFKATFPNNLIQLASDITLCTSSSVCTPPPSPQSLLTTVIVPATSMSTANSTGEFTFTVGVPLGGDINQTSPSVDFEIAKIRVRAITTSVQTANINISSAPGTDIVNPTGASLSFVVNNAVINLNGTGGGASLYFTPQNPSLNINTNPTTTLSLMLNPNGNQIGFVKTEATFDTTKVQLNSGIIVSGSPLTTVIQKSTVTQANTTGKFTIVLGLSTGSRGNPPSTTFEIGKIPIRVVTTQANQTATINFTQTEIVGMNENVFTPQTTPATISLNTTTATSTPMPTPTSAPTGTLTPTPTTTATPTCVSGQSLIVRPACYSNFNDSARHYNLLNINGGLASAKLQARSLKGSLGGARIGYLNDWTTCPTQYAGMSTSTGAPGFANSNFQYVEFKDQILPALGKIMSIQAWTGNDAADLASQFGTDKNLYLCVTPPSPTPTPPPTADMEVGLGRIVPQYPTGGQRFDWIEVLLTNKGTTAINQALTFRTTIRNTTNGVDQCIATETLNVNIPVGQTVGYGLTRRFNTVPTADPCPLLEAGKSYTVTILGDSTNVLAESNENNNTVTFSFTTP